MHSPLSVFYIVLLALLLITAAASAHEGHDHAADSKTMSQLGASPRLEATSGPFGLVALLRQGELIIYLDEVETNTPITTASMVVETPAGPIDAEAREGIHRLTAPWGQTGSLNLIFTVTVGNRTEILSGALTITPRISEQSLSWSKCIIFRHRGRRLCSRRRGSALGSPAQGNGACPFCRPAICRHARRHVSP
jgi:hypothetical protein